ncbi:MAG: hybrid sensor histidine kinase/response regulator [Deltaproteobacteria bacterium]|nr:hybrid sensor histidine kinase/response regulator [Deltaproteobacteria bacterium]
MARKRTTAQPSGHTILVIDDQEEILTSVRLLLEREGHQVLTALSGEEGLTLFRREKIHLVIVDYFMPGMTGEDVVRVIRQFDSDVQILLQTGYSGEKPALATLRELDIQGYHSKTDGPEHLLLWVEATRKAAAHLLQVRAVEQLKAETLVKQEFLANVSHEMRSRLHLILGYSDVLLVEKGNPGLPLHSRQSVETIQRHSRALWGLTTNFLNFVKLNAEAMRVSPRPFSLAELQKEFQESTEFLLRHKPVSFVWDVPPQLPLVWADRDKLCIILQNLLTNAAKFTDQGEIRLRAVASPVDNGVCIRVSDTGIGIAPESRETIFETFQQIPNTTSPSRSTVEAGIGIGLTLARKLARMMDGDLTVESAVGAGSTFTLLLRISAEEVRGSEVSSSVSALSSPSNTVAVPSFSRSQPALPF